MALSGGGFRATLYHLGLVRFLRDAGILRNVTHITSVSGGSIIAAHLALHWSRYNGTEQDFDAAAAELLAYMRLDVRNRIVRRFPLGFSVRWLRRLVGLSNRKLTRTGLLEHHYQQHLFGDVSLFELPETPQLHILATNLSEGRLTSFNRDGLWHIRRDAGHGFRIDRERIGLATVPMAVAASSAFPGFFPPMLLTGEDVGARSGTFGRQSFTDGGVFDNLGVRMMHFLARAGGESALPWDGVLVSDVGKPFEVQSSAESVGMVRTAMRASDILMDRVWQLESETFKDTPGYVFARITDVVQQSEDPTAMHPELQRQLPSIRTDLDRFTPLEMGSLIRHGYCVARKACRALPKVFGDELPQNPPWAPDADAQTQGASPVARELTQVTKAARTLHASGARRIWSTLFDFRDWASYVYVPIIVPILVLTPYFTLKYYEYSHRMNQIIQSLAQGSRDVDQMSRLMDGPIARFAGEKYEQLAPGQAVDRAGFTILQDLRMIDLRRWYGAKTTAANSYMYGYRRLKVRREPDNDKNNVFRASVLAIAPDTQVRFPPQTVKPKLYASDAGTTPAGQKMIHWEIQADFRRVPPGDVVDIVYEHISPGAFVVEGTSSNTISFSVEEKTAELTRWLLMPEGREYKDFLLIRYKDDNPDLSEKVKLATEYLAEDRTILAFKLLGLEGGYTYELTWFYK
ncbi:MAG: patatin-like phospholipase family protein [Betaproteobacteria bacterium]|nr:patatin-like phospholipase family protein [Betaproteobacteria bacterium]MBV9361236.1 patatin-like phospholipase family protein [Betaproteobacteria bacterium]